MKLKKVQQEYKEALPGEIPNAVIENFLFGLSGAVIVPFIAVRFDVAV